MFTPPESKEQVSEQNMPPKEGAVTAEVSSEDIHTMPNRFLKPSVPKKKGRLNWLILGTVIVVALGGVIAVVVVFLGRQTEQPTINLDINQPIVNQNTNQEPVNQNLNTNQNQNSNVNQSPDTASARDIKKLEDATAIRSALSLYYKTYEVFPTTLSSLLENYLIDLPQDPLTEESYIYFADSGQQNYQLYISLEENSEWGIMVLPQGDYYFSAEGIFPDDVNQNSNINNNTNNSVPIPPPPVVITPSMGLDSDGDQLTDIEENIYQTKATLADTDGDGYTDATEILNFYDPLDPEGRLINSGLTDLYQNPDYNYSVVYPAAWVVRSLTVDSSEIIFTSNTGEFIEIIIQENPLSLSALNWYLSQNPTIDSTTLETLVIDGFPAVQTKDGLTTYLSVGSNIYIIAYNIGAQQQMYFYTTYQLLLRSFMFIELE